MDHYDRTCPVCGNSGIPNGVHCARRKIFIRLTCYCGHEWDAERHDQPDDFLAPNALAVHK